MEHETELAVVVGFVVNKKGTPRWKRMVSLARKHLIKEGFIEDDKGWDWRITRKGRQAAKASVES